MKTFKTIHVFLLFSLIVAGFCFTACNNTEDGSYVPPITLSEKINGKWVLNSIKQVDEIAAKDIDLSGQLNFMSFSIDLQADTDNNPTTFSVIGNAPALLPASGNWEMEHFFTNSDGKPARIFLYGDADKSQKTAVLTVTATPGTNRVLEFKLTRKQQGQAFVSYIYNLVPATANK
ncbi:DUF5004 domain-containing protein [Bacteroides uniformis]|uniref:DUF5004 domain-containing protein n=1 Tax=Bacteroides uniformis TaxID=820 RepID=A0AA37N9I1_BACUN|nr:DUF5004 domain-containing protein [Bacteroides uniformis]GKH15576.1 hypothetical protein CE91St12_37860 [Bacteroides uniformis]GKH38915.1 hypothetical protein CE91St13_37860 [Bacteroides uniformis]